MKKGTKDSLRLVSRLVSPSKYQVHGCLPFPKLSEVKFEHFFFFFFLGVKKKKISFPFMGFCFVSKKNNLAKVQESWIIYKMCDATNT